jgi:hypothetical protein
MEDAARRGRMVRGIHAECASDCCHDYDYYDNNHDVDNHDYNNDYYKHDHYHNHYTRNDNYYDHYEYVDHIYNVDYKIYDYIDYDNIFFDKLHQSDHIVQHYNDKNNNHLIDYPERMRNARKLQPMRRSDAHRGRGRDNKMGRRNIPLGRRDRHNKLMGESRRLPTPIGAKAFFTGSH